MMATLVVVIFRMKPPPMRNLLLVLMLAFTASVMAQNYTADYLKIADFEKEGKFKSALEAADALFKKADRDGDEDDMLKVMAIRAAYTFQLEENGVEAALKLFNDELANNTLSPIVLVRQWSFGSKATRWSSPRPAS